jgi:hypothetical protein
MPKLFKPYSIDKNPLAPPGYVYLARHRIERRFKVGLSINPMHRLSHLPEARVIDYSRSLQMQLPSPERAGQVERGLHLLLQPWRLLGPPGNDGYTEWFDIQAWPHAVTSLESLATDPLEARAAARAALLLPLGQMTAFGPDPTAAWSPLLRPLTKVLYEVARHCLVEVQRQEGHKGPCQGLRIWSLRHAYHPPMHSLRYAVMDPQLYEVPIEQPDAQDGPATTGPRTLLAGPIQWAQQRPDDLLIPLATPAAWRRYGRQGEHVQEALRGMTRRLVSLSREWHQGAFVEPVEPSPAAVAGAAGQSPRPPVDQPIGTHP